MWDSYQLIGHAIRAWVYQRLYGLSGVINIWGGIWVVLNRNGGLCIKGHPLLNPAGFGQVLDQPHPLLFLLLSPRGGAEDFCFLFGPITILASTAVRRLSASRSVPSPPSSFWPRRHLLSRIQRGRFAYFRRLVSMECIVKHCLTTRIVIYYQTPFLVIFIKLQFLIIFVPYCDYVQVFYNFI